MKTTLKLAVLLLLVLGSGPAVYATDSVTSSGILLKKLTNVRAAGMGDAHTAMQTDAAGAGGWNPAGLYGQRYPGVSASYVRGLAGDNFGAMQGYAPMVENLDCGANLIFYDAGSFELNSLSGETSILPAQQDILLALTGACHLESAPWNSAAGVTLKLLRSTLLGQYSAMAAAIDVGVQSRLPEALKSVQVGLALKNIGTPIQYLDSPDPLPSYALLGIAYPLATDKTANILLAGDVQFDLDSKWQGCFGAEAFLYEMVSLRIGYKNSKDLNTVTLGLGFDLHPLRLDYAFTPLAVLDSVHSASLNYTFGPDPRQKAVEPAMEKPINPADYYQLEDLAGQPGAANEKVPANVIDVQRAGGRVAKVIVNIGSHQSIAVGMKGIVVDAASRPLAAITIIQVEPEISLAEVVGQSKDIQGDVKALIERPRQP